MSKIKPYKFTVNRLLELNNKPDEITAEVTKMNNYFVKNKHQEIEIIADDDYLQHMPVIHRVISLITDDYDKRFNQII